MTETNDTIPPLNRRLILQKYPVDGQAVKRLVIAGHTWLNTNKQTVNALNVFPVPDGDTGTNMVLTMESAVKEMENSPERHAGKMVSSVAHGALMGARGNSGVILSQIWRGISRGLEEEEYLTGEGLAGAFAEARDTAYRGVVRPVEGTILTVIKDVATATKNGLRKTNDAMDILEIALAEAAESVERTPDLLPVLKEAGVVDSGGKGLFYLLEGMVRWMNGESLDTPITEMLQPLSSLNFENAMDGVEEGQDYEVVVDFSPKDILDLKSFYDGLEEMGVSIQVGEGDGIYRMHIHVPTENLYKPIDYCMELGTVTNVAIENLIAQMEELEADAQVELQAFEPDQIAVVSVVPGPGFAKLFASLGVAALVEGGQTMNPSTENILAAFENLPTNNVILLPNNKNIFMSCQTAAEFTVKNVEVVNSRTMPQGISAMMRLIPDGDLETIAKEMREAVQEVESGEITTAVRDVEIDGVDVKQGQIITLLNGKLISSTSSLDDACMVLFEKLDMDDFELITLFYGNNITPAETQEIAGKIEEKYPEHELEIQNGGQAHYQFILSIE